MYSHIFGLQAGGVLPPSWWGPLLFKCELCLLITKWNAGRTSSYPILSYFTGFLYNKDIFPENIAVAGNYNRPVHGGGRKIEPTFLDLILWFKPALYDEKKILALLCYPVEWLQY
jgi:hypothetical protein